MKNYVLLAFILMFAACSKPAGSGAPQKTTGNQPPITAPANQTPSVSKASQNPSDQNVEDKADQNRKAAPVVPAQKPITKKQQKPNPSSTAVEEGPAPISEPTSTPPQPIVQGPVRTILPAPENPAPPPPTTRQITVPAGTLIPIRTIESVDSRTDQAGQTFRASIDSAITIDSEIVVPKGAEAFLKLTRVVSAGDLRGKSELQLELDRIVVGNKSYIASSNVVERSGAAQGPKTAKDAAIGAAIGAVIGAIAGGGKGAAIGAGAGAGSGVAVAAITKGEQVLVPSETRLDFRLEQPLQIDVETLPPPASSTTDKSFSGPRKLGEDSSTWPRPEADRHNISNLSGEWRLSIDGPQVKRTLRLFLDQDGKTLRGTIRDPMRGEARLRGYVEGDSIRFSTESEMPRATVKSEYTGTIVGTRLQGTVTMYITGRRYPGPLGRGGRTRRGSTDERWEHWTAQRVES